MTPEEKRREDAKRLRYKKPIVKMLASEFLLDEVYAMSEEIDSVAWAYDNELINDLLGEEEAFEFKMMFASLSSDCVHMMDDLSNEWVPERMDDLMVVVSDGNEHLEMLGYDAYEGDYFSIAGYESAARYEAKKRLMRLTKDELIQTAQQSFGICWNFIGLQDRFSKLKTSIEVLKGFNLGFIEQLKQIDEAYEKANNEKFVPWGDGTRALERLCQQIEPSSAIWVQ